MITLKQYVLQKKKQYVLLCTNSKDAFTIQHNAGLGQIGVVRGVGGVGEVVRAVGAEGARQPGVHVLVLLAGPGPEGARRLPDDPATTHTRVHVLSHLSDTSNFLLTPSLTNPILWCRSK